MRVHFICKRYYTNKDLFKDRFGRLYHLPVELARRGVQVSVDAIDYKSVHGEKFESEGVAFQSIPAVRSKLFAIPFSLARNARKKNPDIIIASGDSHIGFIAMLIAKRLGARFVFDVYDYYPAFRGNAIPGMKMLFSRSVKGAKLVLCASEQLMNELLPLNKKRLLIENGVDPKLFCPSDMSIARKDLGLAEEFQYIGYFGSIDRDRGPLLIEACRILREEFPLLHLLFAGNVTKVDLNEPWIMYFGELPQNKLPMLINACNLVAVPYSITDQIKLSGACKIAEYLACDKPVVATCVSDHEQIFREAPRSLSEPTANSLAEAIKRQLENPQIASFPVRLSWNHIGIKLLESLKIEMNSSV